MKIYKGVQNIGAKQVDKMKEVDTQYIEVIDSPIHGKGLRAAKDIPKDTHILEYVGDIIDNAEFERRTAEHEEKCKLDPSLGQVYMFELSETQTIDGNVSWNVARFVNHSCSPNVEVCTKREGIWYKTLRDIKKGEELFINYGFDLDEYEANPCKCGAPNCVGYIVAQEHWNALKDKIALKLHESGKIDAKLHAQSATQIHSKNITEYVDVVQSPIHGKGLCAAKDIPKNTYILEYVGDIITKDEYEKRTKIHDEKFKADPSIGQVYMFEIYENTYVDGDVDYNYAKYVNHSCSPNVEVCTVREGIWYKTLQDIKKGEELFINYGFDLDEYAKHPCKCGAPNCVGHIVAEEHWPKLKEILAQQK
jgi:uncharacterized protein